MAQFVFQAKTGDGRFIKGEVEANNDTEARVKIRAQKLVPLKVVPKGADTGQKNFAAKKGLLAGKVKAKDLQIFTRQFAVLIGAGVPVVQSLQAMVDGARNPVLTKALRRVLTDVEKGKRLAEAMTVHPGVFDRMYVNLVRAGEEGGVLDDVLNRLASYIEKSVKLKGKIKGAMFYPAAIVVVAILVIAGIMIFVIPNFVEMFASVGQDLPALTQWVISASDFVRDKWYLLLGGMIAVPILIKMYYDTSEGRKHLDMILIETPLFGPLIQKGALARMSRTLATLLGAGVRIMDSLDIAATTAGNYMIETNIRGAKASVTKGKTLAEPLRQSKYIPDMVSQMMAVGEQTGNLDIMLNKIADFYEDEVETAADALTSMIEPLLMVFLGGVIAILVVAMYLPIFGLAGAIG